MLQSASLSRPDSMSSISPTFLIEKHLSKFAQVSLRNVQKQTQPLDKITSCLDQYLVTLCIWFSMCVYEWLHVPALMLSLQPYI